MSDIYRHFSTKTYMRSKRMPSKTIFDSELLLEEKPLLDLTEATKYLPIKCSRATI